MSTKVVELYGVSTSAKKVDWAKVVAAEQCPFLARKCVKTRKSQPEISIGTCTVEHGGGPVIICPIRLRERHQIFFDCMHLLTLHEPGNELHAVPEISVPGGSLDFVLVSARDGKVRDFVGIEIQTLDTTGTLWPERQRFINSVGLSASKKDIEATTSYGMNWKMTAKTILMQLHHKIQTFEHLNKRLALALQDRLLNYMEGEFSFGHLNNPARNGDSMHFHSYKLAKAGENHTIKLRDRKSTDMAGIATALGLQISARVELEVIVAALEEKLSPATRLQIASK
jgi:hypothetical protein